MLDFLTYKEPHIKLLKIFTYQLIFRINNNKKRTKNIENVLYF